MGNPNPNIRNELIQMCTQLVNGATLVTVSGCTRVGLGTIRARRGILLKLDVQMKTTMLRGRGYGTPFYVLDEPLETAIKKIDAKYKITPKVKKPREKKQYAREEPTRALHPGFGIESWFFINAERSKEYLLWCDEWASKGQKFKDIYCD